MRYIGRIRIKNAERRYCCCVGREILTNVVHNEFY